MGPFSDGVSVVLEVVPVEHPTSAVTTATAANTAAAPFHILRMVPPLWTDGCAVFPQPPQDMVGSFPTACVAYHATLVQYRLSLSHA